MDPSNRAGQQSGRSSGVASPSNDHPPAGRTGEQAAPRGDEGLSESFQSTDTVRRRPEGVSYGKPMLPPHLQAQS